MISNPTVPRRHNFPRKLRVLPWFVCILALLAFQGSALASRIVNLSTRANVGTGNNVMIGGFIVQGSGTATLVFRGIGPSLDPYFADPVLANPALELRNSSGTLLYYNDNWQDSQGGEIIAAGLAPGNPYESAIKWWVTPGLYTVILNGVGGGTGLGLVEVYDITPQPNAIRLGNVSTRAHSANGDLKETLGMIIQGSGNKPLLIRGLGPSIPLPGTLPNPFLQLYNSSGVLLQLNENWKDTQQSQIQATGAAPTNNLESAMISTLAPGAYTAKLQDNSGATGIAVVDMYDLNAVPTPTATPPPAQSLKHQDTVGGATYAGYNSSQHPNDPNFAIKTSPQLNGGAGTITIHFTGHAHGTCHLGCPGGIIPPPFGAEIWPELLNSQGVKVAEGTHLPLIGADVSASRTATFGWSGGAFSIRMMARSSTFFPSADYVILSYYDVYAP